MSGTDGSPTASALVGDLAQLRKVGLPNARYHRLAALTTAAALTAEKPQLEPHTQIEALMKRAITALDEGDYGDQALALFGFVSGTRGFPPSQRRAAAAQIVGVTADSYRRRYEPQLIGDLADKIRELCAEAALRGARVELERRHPGDSRLAVQWVERFEAYHRMWTPAWALAADLTAYRSTLIDPDRPYDEFDEDGGQTYSQEEQADGYAKFALYRWASFQWQLRQFTLQHGGMWLLSSPEAEIRIADLVYEIGWHVTVFNERDHSWLRNAISQSPGEELDHFQTLILTTPTGETRLSEWRIWCRECQCTWKRTQPEGVRFPTAVSESGVSGSCQLHKVVAACHEYCSIVELEWSKIADWYHIESRYKVGVRSSDLYDEWRRMPNGGAA